jgi:dihydrofolate synthase/folylpolyglutamate synthase
MYLLGDTLEEIAFEKAGIIKEKVPVVIGEVITETRPVFEKQAATKNAPIVFAQQERWVGDYYYHKHLLHVQVAQNRNDERELYQLDLAALYQTKNLVTVLESAQLLNEKGWNISRTHLHKALCEVKKLTGLHGRWDVIHQHPMLILDVAHNEDGIKEVVKQIEIVRFHHLHIVLGFVKDKDIPKVLDLMPKYAKYYFTKAAIERALPEQQLADEASKFELIGHTFENVNLAVQSALDHASNDDLIVVCGSVFVVGEVQKELLRFPH